MSRIRTSVYVGVSVDGFIARAGGEVDFLDDHAPAGSDLGWADFIGSVDVLVMGRATFDSVLNAGVAWPYGDLTVVVWTHRPLDLPAELSHVEASELGPRELLDGLGERGFRHAYVDGGRTVQQFLQEGLIDEITLTTVPTLIGEGTRIFGALSGDVHLEHAETTTYGNGFVQTRYRVVA